MIPHSTDGKQRVLSLSYGKDSMACLGAIEQLGWPLDRIVTADRDKYRSWWAEAYDENRQLKAAICKWFLRAFKEG